MTDDRDGQRADDYRAELRSWLTRNYTDTLAAVLDDYPESVMFASDYPHGDGVFPGAATELLETGSLDEEQRRRVLSGNAERFYSI